MLVHICCSVDSHFFLEQLQQSFPDETLIGFFYDPNIHPYAEYRLRLLDVRRSCDRLGIELIEGPYDLERWFELIRGMEDQPEQSQRCERCFERRLEVSMRKAQELGITSMTTTLLVSPQKSQEQLIRAAKAFETLYGVRFVVLDYRAHGGTQRQQEVAKREQLYRQDYCGCLPALTRQRHHQHRVMDEMFSPITRQILPASIEERLELYSQRIAYEEQGRTYRILKERFLNYRLLNASLSIQTTRVSSYPLAYSTLSHHGSKGRIIGWIDGQALLNRDEVRFIPLEHFNHFSTRQYHSTAELMFDPPSWDEELAIRRHLCWGSTYDTSALIVVDHIAQDDTITLTLESLTYADTREHLVCLH